MPYLFSKT